MTASLFSHSNRRCGCEGWSHSYADEMFSQDNFIFQDEAEHVDGPNLRNPLQAAKYVEELHMLYREYKVRQCLS
ncbi:unnamed protein product [Urochloa humidicola]